MTTFSLAPATSPWRLHISWLRACVLCFALAGCGGDSAVTGASDAGGTTATLVPGPVFGKVSLDGPVAGATVSLQAANGSAWPGSAVTDEEGMFEIPAEQVPQGLRILASGGTLPDGSAVSATLSTYVEPFGAGLFGEQITAVSTLLDRLHTAGWDLETAQVRLAAYLQLEPGRSLYSGFADASDFNSAAFQRAAQESGLGLDGFIDQQVAQAMVSAESRQAFTGGLRLSPFGTTVALGLINGAVSKLSGTATGELLSGLGVGQADHAEVMAQLRLIESKLDEVRATVDEAVKRIAALQVEIKQGSLDTLISRIRGLMKDLRNMAGYSGDRASKQLEVENAILSLYGLRTAFADVLNGALAKESIIQAYAESLHVGQRFYSVEHYRRLIDFVELFDSYNLQMHYLLIEAFRSREARTGKSAQGDIEMLVRDMEEERDLYMGRLPRALPDDTTFIHADTLRMWHSSRDYYVLHDEIPRLPAAVAAKGGWRKPELSVVTQAFKQTDRNRIDGNVFALQQGAPSKLFAGGGINMWTSECSWDVRFVSIGTCWVYHFADDNPMYIGVTRNNDSLPSDLVSTNRAHYAVWRPMEQAEAAMYLPWLYSQRQR
ncbi:hypothetical protein PIGHUM_00667 [Pigmentiphaga humi]|uniref:Carboxypeptidase regulatory-like domain-containing protein n=1 Tax=Pigmentiphaga humi TaxID=2478468 RepID=A0A3P4AYT3_9BURK|nr:Ig-like domain-containing protein [Pigmentiphaga humi]VCU68610.1 hypothetical protein PIGHUM_00667 [Pigmentiphaga humi]